MNILKLTVLLLTACLLAKVYAADLTVNGLEGKNIGLPTSIIICGKNQPLRWSLIPKNRAHGRHAVTTQDLHCPDGDGTIAIFARASGSSNDCTSGANLFSAGSYRPRRQEPSYPPAEGCYSRGDIANVVSKFCGC